jgi:LysM repeat protein
MNWSLRIVVLLLLIGTWTTGLLSMAHPARAQALDNNVHVVEPGDTLSQIARQYGTDVATLRQLNNLDSSDWLQVGQQLRVAEGGRSDRPAYESQYEGQNQYRNSYENHEESQESWEVVESYPAPQEYVVRAGDDLRSIAAAYQLTPAALVRENQLSSPIELVPGQVLRIPLSGGTAAWSPEPGSYGGSPYTQESARPESYRRQGESYAPDSDESEFYASPYQRQENQRQGNQRPGESHAHETYGRGDADWQDELTGEKWIDIDLSEQRLIAYQGDTVVRVFSISSGKSSTPTVTGSFRIWAKVDMQDMSGGSREAGTYYYQPDVPWVQYFYEDYAIHGAYWHNSFGQPIGHGCINMRVDESEWLYEWTKSAPSARVEVHY